MTIRVRITGIYSVTSASRTRNVLCSKAAVWIISGSVIWGHRWADRVYLLSWSRSSMPMKRWTARQSSRCRRMKSWNMRKILYINPEIPDCMLLYFCRVTIRLSLIIRMSLLMKTVAIMLVRRGLSVQDIWWRNSLMNRIVLPETVVWIIRFIVMRRFCSIMWNVWLRAVTGKIRM